MSIIRCEIDGKEVFCDAGTTVLEAAESIGIRIPTLCYFRKVNRLGACRVCVVEIEGMSRLMPSCMTQVRDGMKIRTDNDRVLQARRQTVDLLCRHHRMDCEYCPHYTFCELHGLLRRLGMDDRRYTEVYHERCADESSACIVRDYSKCVKCRRCVSACKKQGVEAISAFRRAEEMFIGTAVPLSETACTGCGQCVRYCPTGALFVRDDTDLLWRALNQKKKIVFGITPETAANIGRFFGESGEKDEMDRLNAVCQKAGAFEVFDLTGLEKAALAELAEDIETRHRQGWKEIQVSFCPAEKYRKTTEKNESKNCGEGSFEDKNGSILFGKNPEKVFSDAVLTCLEKRGIHRDEVFLVYVSPCSAAKREHVCDAVLTTTELFAWFQRACVSRTTARAVWNGTKPEKSIRLFNWADKGVPEHTEEYVPERIDKPEIHLVYACPEGCSNGGGQFRAGPTECGLK